MLAARKQGKIPGEKKMTKLFLALLEARTQGGKQAFLGTPDGCRLQVHCMEKEFTGSCLLLWSDSSKQTQWGVRGGVACAHH